MKAILTVGFFICCQWACLATGLPSDSLVNVAAELRAAGDHTGAKSIYQQLLEKDTDNEELYFGLGESHFALRNYDSALIRFKEYIPKAESTAQGLEKLRTAYGRLGYIYRYIKRDYRNALLAFDKEAHYLAHQQATISDKERHLFANNYNLATTHRLLEDYENALNFGFAALDVIQQQAKSDQRRLILSYSVIANILGDMEDYDRASDYHIKKINLSESAYGPDHPQLADYYNNAAIDFYAASRMDEAEMYFSKALSVAAKNQSNTKLRASSHRGISSVFENKGDYTEARKHLDAALQYAGTDPFQIAITKRHFGQHFMELHKYDSALLMFQQAMGTVISGFEWHTVDDNPAKELLFASPYYYRLLNYKAECWLEKYEHQGKTEDLLQAYHCYQLIDELTQMYRDNFSLESSKSFFQSWNYRNCEKSMKALYAMYEEFGEPKYLAQAWMLMEKNKSLLLLENLAQAERTARFDIPDSLKQSLSKTAELAWNSRMELNKCNLDEACAEAEQIRLRQATAQAEADLAQQKEQMSTAMPNYFQAADNQDFAGLQEARSSLSNDQLMINFFATEEVYFMIALSKDGVQFEKVPLDTLINTAIPEFLDQVSGQKLAEEGPSVSFDKLSTTGELIYDRFMSKVLTKNNASELILITDGLLSLLPFEALITSAPEPGSHDFSSLNYLIKDYQIGYGYSATLWLQNQDQLPVSADSEIVAFGSSRIKNRPDLPPLPGTEEETNSLQAVTTASVYSNQQASESNFKAHSQEAEIIHLALHNANDVKNPLNSRLIFNQEEPEQDGELHLFELYGLDLHPKLVVLSACETGVAEWQKGEGPYHMGRGFLYHGNPALVLSLWKVRDATAAGLMKNFYDGLQSSENSSKALRDSKLAFIEQSDELTAHPSNWAAFIGIGKVTVKNERPWWVYLTVASLFAVTLFVRKKNKKRLFQFGTSS